MVVVASRNYVLRENLWEIRPDDLSSYVETPDGIFEIDTASALQFQRVRAHCTGHNSVDMIAARSGLSVDDVLGVLEAAEMVGMRVSGCTIAPEDRSTRLKRIVEMWAEELKRSFVGNRLLDPEAGPRLLKGWLLETYHYVADFPEAIALAAERTQSVELRQLLQRYTYEERGHERFVLNCLVRLGFDAEEVRQSSPLLSTQLIAIKMRDLFLIEPSSVLLMAAMVEAQEFDSSDVVSLQREIEAHHGIPEGALAPFFEHQRIDFELGHHLLLDNNISLLSTSNAATTDLMVNALHDLKHAFDLQNIEIAQYYGSAEGQYIPRQPLTMAAL